MRGEGTVLLWGLREDPPTAAVWNALEGMPCRRIFVNQRAVLSTSIDIKVGARVEGVLRAQEAAVRLSAVKAVYLRPYEARELPNVVRAGENSALWRRAIELQDILLSWAEVTPALVLNRASHMASNSSKPYQCALIALHGFRVPETLITTDPHAALEFQKQHKQIVYKSVSSVRSIVTRMTREHHDRIADIAACPTQFQRYIAGTDYRVHVVGRRTFACTVTADADDYRYAEGPVEMKACKLPRDLRDRCVRMARSMHLALAGIDLRRTPRGDWYCYEVNPSPAFTTFEAKTGQPIAQAVAQLLASATRP